MMRDVCLSDRPLTHSACVIAALLPFALSDRASADEAGVSFWLQGQFGSFAATPSNPGWSFESTFYHATAAANPSLSFVRGGGFQTGARVADENERNDDRERRQEAEQADADRAEPVALRQSRTLGLGQLEQSLPHQFELVRPQDRPQHGWQRVRDDAMGVSDIGGRAHSPQLHGVAPSLVEASHQKHAGVDDSPGQVTAECGEEHGPNLDAVCGYDAEGQGEGKRHYQAEQDLRNPVHRFEDSIG